MARGSTCRRLLAFVLVVILLSTLAVIGLRFRTPDPVYKEKHLSEYLGTLGPVPLIPGVPFIAGRPSIRIAGRPSVRPEAAEAVRALGTNAVPLLKSWLNSNPPAWRAKLFYILQRRGRYYPQLIFDRRRAAAKIAGVLSKNGADLLPDLERCSLQPENLRAPDLADSAAAAYVEILQATTADKEALVRKLLLFRPGSHADFLALAPLDRADPDWRIRHMITLESGSEAAKVGAASYFKEHPINRDRIIPLLDRCLGSTNRSTQIENARALAQYRAKESLPLISNLLSSPYPKVRDAASEAIADLKK